MTPEQLSETIVDALAALVADGAITLPDGVPTQVTVERPRQKGHGDYATNVAMQLAKRAGTNPRAFAELVAAQLRASDGVGEVEIAGPGFLNITVEAAAQGQVAADIVAAGEAYGSSDAFAGEKINLEFVSANPTGPLHLGGVRWAAVGDALGRIFTKTGADVTREYYFNDHGAQIDRFSSSLLASAQGRPAPEDGYGGQYIHDIANAIVQQRPDVKDLDDAAAQEVFRQVGVDMMFEEIKQSLHDFGVDFDVYFHEKSLHDSGAVERAIERLTEMGNTYTEDGALWLRTEQYGDDKDRVIIRSNGTPAYISGDLGYYLDKRERGFDQNLVMLGADHHGYVGRLMAMTEAFGDIPGQHHEILIGQMVNLVREGEPVRMSKRAGTIVTLDDLVDAVGVDAGRYALVRSSSDSQVDIDLDQWGKRTNDNPVFYVQYAHARTRSVARNAATSGVERTAFAPELLTHDSESALLGVLQEYPRIVALAAELREPHRIARYIEELAGYYHRWYDNCRVIPLGDEPVTDLHRTRLWLNDATGQVIRNGLGLLGVSAPERM